MDFDMAAIDTLSRKFRSCARSHRARRSTIWKTCTAPVGSWLSSENSLGETCSTWTAQRCTVPASARPCIVGTSCRPKRRCSYPLRSGPAGIPTQQAFSQDLRWPSLDTDREGGCVREMAHAYSQEGGLRSCSATLRSWAAWSKPPAWTMSHSSSPALLTFVTARKPRCDILEDRVQAGDVVIVRYEGPAADPACRKCSTPPATSNPRGLEKPAHSLPMAASPVAPRAVDWACVTEAAAGGAIA